MPKSLEYIQLFAGPVTGFQIVCGQQQIYRQYGLYLLVLVIKSPKISVSMPATELKRSENATSCG